MICTLITWEAYSNADSASRILAFCISNELPPGDAIGWQGDWSDKLEMPTPQRAPPHARCRASGPPGKHFQNLVHRQPHLDAFQQRADSTPGLWSQESIRLSDASILRQPVGAGVFGNHKSKQFLSRPSSAQLILRGLGTVVGNVNCFPSLCEHSGTSGPDPTERGA